MKKAFLFATLFAVTASIPAIAQQTAIINNTGCSIKVHMYGDNSGAVSTCTTNNFVEAAAVVIPATTTWTYSNLTDFNDNSCATPGLGLPYANGWSFGTCFTTSASNEWDGALVNINNTQYFVGPCWNASQTAVGGCGGSNVVIDWNTSLYPYPVLILH